MAVNGSHSGGYGDSLWKPRVKKTWAINYRLRGRSSLQGGVGIQHVIRRENGVLLGKAFLGFFPTATMVFFQGLFAGITLILIAGALLGRMNFRACRCCLCRFGLLFPTLSLPFVIRIFMYKPEYK